jgi:hypothetical protein
MTYRGFVSAQVFAKFGTYEEWKQKAAVGYTVLCTFRANPANAGRSVPVDSSIYGAVKNYLKAYFYGKCAYCDSYFDHVAFGDVEHYRPKRGVEDCEGHPGYYWLAYQEENLLPSCELCNRGKGKRNRFPIRGCYAMTPEAKLSEEFPLLLNPYDEGQWRERASHLEYEFKIRRGELWPTGRVRGTSPEGRVSVQIYQLNRRSLIKFRRRSQHTALTAIKHALTRGDFDKVYAAQFDSRKQYSAAVQAACRRWKEELVAKLLAQP